MLRTPRLILLLLMMAPLLTIPSLAQKGAPRRNGAPLTVIAIGDAGEVGPALTGNARNMLDTARRRAEENRPVGLLLFLGDNVYPHGFNDMTDRQRATAVDRVFGPHMELMRMLGRGNVHAIPGNHDYYCTALEGVIPYGTCDLGNEYEAGLDFWTYHPHLPAIVRRATAEGSADSADFILFDSSLLMNQDPGRWRPVLDSLEKLLRSSATSRGVRWRILAAHHSPFSVGEHGGYRLWLPKQKRVGYIGNCYREGQDPYRYAQQIVSDQDNCTAQYRRYNDSLFALIERSGAKVQLMMAGHDHSLQLLNYPDSACASCPKVYIVTGAGSKREKVRSPLPGRIYSHPFNTAKEKGRSASGFTLLTFTGGRMEIGFVESATGTTLDMGGATRFVVDADGVLTTE
jgi:hypothetical protein